MGFPAYIEHSTAPTTIDLTDEYVSELLKVINEDMDKSNNANVGGPNLKWEPDGYFKLVPDSKSYIYIYYNHECYATISSVYYSQLERCIKITSEKIDETSICFKHEHHHFLSPFFMDNAALKLYYGSLVCAEGIKSNHKDELEVALSFLNSRTTVNTPYTCPSKEANNWDENDWTERLYYCITSNYPQTYNCSVHLTYGKDFFKNS